MSKKKSSKKPKWGGPRMGAGRKPREGGTEKICVSVNKNVWQAAKNHWNGKASRLVDMLLFGYIEAVKGQKMGAI